MTFDLSAEIERVTRDWKEAQKRTDAAFEKILGKGCMDLTFADIPDGDEFYDEDGNLWEKRSEKTAVSWIQGERPVVVDFEPTDRVRMG